MELNMNTSVDNIAYLETMNRAENGRVQNLKSCLEREKTTPRTGSGLRYGNPKNYPPTTV